MKQSIKRALIFALALLPVSLAAGYLTGLWQMDTLSADLAEQILQQLGSKQVLAVIAAVQAAGYALVCGFVGCLLAQNTGLWKPLRIEKQPLVTTLVLSAVFGIIFSLDYWTFGRWYPLIAESTPANTTPIAFAASVLYGGVVEEVLLRLFFMTGIAWLIGKVTYKKAPAAQWKPWVFIAANVLATLAFAAGHLPTTFVLFGGLTPLLLVRCFLFNGGFGLFFGWLYRKHGIQYAMIAHAGLHIVSKVIWLLFV